MIGLFISAMSKKIAAFILKGKGVAAAIQYSHLDDLNSQDFLFTLLLSDER
jgi:hypothetical protein